MTANNGKLLNEYHLRKETFLRLKNSKYARRMSDVVIAKWKIVEKNKFSSHILNFIWGFLSRIDALLWYKLLDYI